MILGVLFLALKCFAFSRFQAPEGSPDNLLRAYAVWHNHTLQSTDIPCFQKLALVYHSRAGIGDALSGLVGRFARAVQMGRLFLLGDMGTVHWSTGFYNPLFNWDYNQAIANGYICNVSPSQGHYGLTTSLLVREALPAVIISYGHPTESTSLTQFHSPLPQKFVQWEHLVRQLLRPTSPVLNLLEPTLSQIAQNVNAARVLALVIRTGEQERKRFLQPGDERRFAYCALKWLEMHGRDGDLVYVSSDSLTAKNAVKAFLAESAPALPVFSLEGAGISTAFPESSNATAIMSFADFFMIEHVDILFRTHRSLFAATAVELLGKPNLSWHVISSSACGSNCHRPQFPIFCDEELFEDQREL